MQQYSDTIDQIVQQVHGVNEVKVLEAPQVGRADRRNELLMFAKPELFMVADPEHTRASLNMIFEKLAAFDAEVDGVIIVGGKALEDKEIMNRHYGFINTMSRKASELVNAEDRAKIEELLGVSLDEYKLYGGHEFLKAHPQYNAQTLDELWFTKKSQKVRGGFYVQAYEAEGEKFVLVNGFHPVQLLHFTEPSHRIVLLLLHSDTDWGKLRNDLVGATFPEKAAPTSIRGTLYANPGNYGFETVDIGNNGVHLSAGPYEGLFEVLNFLGNLLDLDPRQQPPLVLKKLMDAGLSYEEALKVTENPTIEVDGRATDLYGATEDVNTDEAVALYVNATRA
nr:MAG: hypothetical protein DIU68_02485 [Chloroflexota bacterium]